MISMIVDLFKANNYTANNVGNGFLLANNESSDKTVFWVVIQDSDLESLVDRQSVLFDACKQANQNAALDKNISMLVLWDTGGSLDLGEMKKKVMTVEEDTYFFKKHVLYFSGKEYERLKSAMGEETLHNYFKRNVASQDVFLKYKNNPLSQEWQALLYRIAIKVPFVDVDIGFSDGLDSLFDMNKKLIKGDGDEKLVDFDHCFFEIKDTDSTAEKYLTALLPALEGRNDGD